jgi:chromosome segregation protein
LLAQERVRRVLPEQVKAARGALEAVDATLTSRRDDLDELTADLERLDARASRLRKQQQAARREWEEATLRVDRLTQSINWHRTQKQRLDREAEEQALELASSEQQQRQSNEQQATTGYALEQIQAQLAALPADGMLSRLSEQERELAQMEGFRQNQQVLVEVHRQSLGQLESQQTARERRIREIDQDREELAQQMNDERRLDLALSEQIADHSEQTAPVEKRLAEVETESQDILTVDDQHRRQVRSAERAQDLAQLTLDQRNAELERLRASISDELGLVHLPLNGDIRGQSPLPLGEVVGQLPTVKKLPTGLESSIQRRRQQLKRMGAINPNAPAEFVELENRYAFLTEQTDDLHEADAKLRQVIAELDTVMAAEFKRTFDAVAAEFRKAFTRLFGGGTARLVLADPDTPMQSGVEIVARPPDRRYQGLALLSGGERSLTAAALIFALLSVSPVPFCVLDEVDAMLDDMNVGRFREMLTELSAQTQFIVITHNRGTVQAADTIYGVSMSADGTSQIISLRLDGESLAAPDGEMRPEY